MFIPRQIILNSTPKMPQNNNRDLLLQSIASFLDINGFRKTLKALQSEASLQIDCWKSTSINLENQFYKILESSTGQTKASVDSQKDKGSVDNLKDPSEKDARKLMASSGNGDIERLEISTDALEETKEKKRKKKSSVVSLAENADDKSMNAGNGASESTDLNLSQKPQENKEKKKKKHKLLDSSDPRTAAEDGDTGKFSEVAKDGKELKYSSNVLFESEEKVEKKKKRRVKDSELEPSNHASEDLHKKEKKKKSKLNSEGLSIASSDVEEKKSDDKKKGNIVNLEIGKSNPPNKNIPIADCSNDETVKSSKKRKRVVESKIDAEESKGKSEDGTANHDNNSDKVGKSSSKNEHPVDTNKKMRTENSEISNPETPIGNKAANGSTDANGSVGGIFSKSMKDEKKSTERKSSVPFQRVKVDEVMFVDERLQDNSYWAKGGADSGYGAKAQEVLGQVKGRDFRHEKTKKKRGSYRGGQIDLNTHSIKFNYSDDE